MCLPFYFPVPLYASIRFWLISPCFFPLARAVRMRWMYASVPLLQHSVIFMLDKLLYTTALWKSSTHFLQYRTLSPLLFFHITTHLSLPNHFFLHNSFQTYEYMILTSPYILCYFFITEKLYFDSHLHLSLNYIIFGFYLPYNS